VKHLLIIVMALSLVSCGKSLDQIHDEVAQDAVKQYNIVKSSGASDIDLCVQAGLVAAAYLQAKNESKYTIWKSRETVDCAKARLGV